MSVTMVTQEMLKSIQGRDGQPVNGAVLMGDYSVSLTKNGKEYISGKLRSGEQVQFKVWNNSAAFGVLKNQDCRGKIVCITSFVDGYNGVYGLTLDSVRLLPDSEFTVDMFLPTRYNIPAYADALFKRASDKISANGMSVLNAVLFNNEPLLQRFEMEFAASSHHDNCKGGLLAHTYKVFNLMVFVITQYPELVSTDGAVDQYTTDLLYIGSILHDIGKTVEMNLGVYQPQSCVTHSFLGAEMLVPFKDKIIEAYDEAWYYDLMSIMLQHHGDWGMPCKTVAAFLVHRVDEFESALTLLHQEMSASEASGKVYHDGKYLSF